MKRKILLLCFLAGVACFLFDDSFLQNVKANVDYCSVCFENQNNCNNQAEYFYEDCLVNYSYAYCNAERAATRDQCASDANFCYGNCELDPNSPGGGGGSGGGGGPTRTPAEQACFDSNFACRTGSYRSLEALECLDAGGSVLKCCNAEYRLCMNNAN